MSLLGVVYIVTILAVSVSVTKAQFNWQKQVDTVYACPGGTAKFPWQYDAVLYDVSMVYWRNLKTRNTVLAHHIKPKDELVYYFPIYENRSFPMDSDVANAGLEIHDITAEDAGDYLIELSGPEGGTDTATLIVHDEGIPILTVTGDEVQPGYSLSVNPDEDIEVAITISGSSNANITIQAEDTIIRTCHGSDQCSSEMRIAHFNRENTTVMLSVRLRGCVTKEYTIFFTSEAGAALVPKSNIGIILGILIPVIIIVIAIIVFLVCRRKTRKREGRLHVKVESPAEPQEARKLLSEIKDGRAEPIALDEVSEKLPLPVNEHINQEPDKIHEHPPDELPHNDIKLSTEESAPAEELKPEVPLEPTLDSPVETIPEAEDHTTSQDLPEKEDKLDSEVSPDSALAPAFGILSDLYKPSLPLGELDVMGFYFNENGQLRTKQKDEPFEFNFYPGERKRNQRRYEDLGEVINDYIYKFMEERLKLRRILIPDGASQDEPCSFFFASPGALKSDKLLILIHGSGVVRAGQWARSLIINHDLDKGSQIPYIHWGLTHGYGVVVLNTNQDTDPRTGDVSQCSRSPEHHAQYIWEKFISTSKASHIAIVAHSYGGIIVTHLADRVLDFRDRVFAVAFTDSVHGTTGISDNTRNFLASKAINWVTSDKPRDTRLSGYGQDAPRFSAGHREHTWTSFAAMESVFAFFEEKYSCL